jgi:hypothetical protein
MTVDSTDEALFTIAMQVHVHNGRTTLFWTLSWLHGVSLVAMFPRLYDHINKKRRTVWDVLCNDNWIRDIIHDIMTLEITEYVLLWELVAEAGFDSQDQQEDEIIWIRTLDGSYSAKSAYEMQFDDSIGSHFPLNVWKVWAPSKCKFFIWLLLQNRV